MNVGFNGSYLAIILEEDSNSADQKQRKADKRHCLVSSYPEHLQYIRYQITETLAQ